MRDQSFIQVGSQLCGSGGDDQGLGLEIVIVVPPLVKIAHSNLTPINSNSLISYAAASASF